MRLKSSRFLSVCLFAVACGGSKAPANEPSSESAATEESAATDASKDSKSDSDASKSEAAASKSEPKQEESSSEGPKVTRTAKDILTAPDVIFMFSFNQSDVKEQAEQQCDSQAKDNPKKRADCLTKAKQKIDADGIAFKQEKGNWYWLTVKRKGKTLVNLHKLPIEFQKDEEHSVVLKPIGKDEGKSPGTAPGETTVEVPNEYEIVLHDPKLGKMVYEAKIGLTDK